MQILKTASADFDSSNTIIHFNKNAILEYKYDIETPQKISLYRKLSDIVYDVETALDCNDNDNDEDDTIDVIDIISNASASIRKYISEYIEFLFNEFSNNYLLFPFGKKN